MKYFLGLLLVGSMSWANVPQEKMIMDWSCEDKPACTQVAGPYGLGTVWLTCCHRYEQIDEQKQSTCCQLAQGVWQQLCRDKIEPKGREIICEE